MAGRRRKPVDDQIDRNLKRAFDELAAAPLPDRFTSLLDRLRAGEALSAPGTPQPDPLADKGASPRKARSRDAG